MRDDIDNITMTWADTVSDGMLESQTGGTHATIFVVGDRDG